MYKRVGLYTVLGLILGAVFIIFTGPAVGTTALAMKVGALGLLIGWFIAALIIENSKGKNKANKQ